MKKFIFIPLFFLTVYPLLSQNDVSYQIFVNKAKSPIQIDGKLDEEDWLVAEKATDFFRTFPDDTSFADYDTEVMVTYDDKFFYFSAICYDDMSKDFVVQSLRRDFSGGLNDFFTIYMDTFGDGLNGFTFGITPLGIEREALIVEGGNRELITSWDNKWYSASQINEDNWTIEVAIPFKTIRYKEGTTPWRVNFARINHKTNEMSSWIPIDRNFRMTALNFTGELVWEDPLPKAGGNIVVIPFVTSGLNQSFEEGTREEDFTADIGGDAKVAITSSLNLDLTINPDFSQVEVDRQVTNLDRFEIFFPERRQFFIENNDLFARFGFSRIRPFFSRRIGIGEDTLTDQIVQNPILYGARLSGKLNQNWRVGFLNMQTAQQENKGISGQNYTVAAFQRKIFSRSNIGAIFVNRQTTSDSLSDFSFNNRDNNQVVGIDYNLVSKDNRWLGKFFYHQTFTPDSQTEQYAHASFLRFNNRNWEITWNHEYVGKNYTADVGFVPRSDHWRLEPSIFYTFYSETSSTGVNSHGPGVYTNYYWDTAGNLTDSFMGFFYNVRFASRARIETSIRREFILLRDDFDPSNTDGELLLSGTGYTFWRYNLEFESNRRARFSWFLGGSIGEFFNGKSYQINTDIRWRIQPYGQIRLAANYTRIELPEPFATADLLLISPRFDLTFTRSLFFTLFLQYNNQIDNVNLNARLQWRFKPVSDLFIVYTDNYFPENFKVKTRAVVLKLTYWLNL